MIPAVLRFLLPLLFALPLLAPCALAAELSGKIHSPTGVLPADITVSAERRDKQLTIAGTVQDGRYRITLPDIGNFRLRLHARAWEAPTKYIWHPATAGALDFLIYPARLPEPALAEELIRIGKLDQEMRANIPTQHDPEFWKRLEASDRKREALMARILDEKGWPAISQVGHEAANGAWLIAQHGTPEFLKRCLPLMKAAAQKHEMALSSLALSIDRVLMHDGKKQLYGSQFQPDKDGRNRLYPVEDMARLDERRSSMGLEPFEDYRKHLEN